MSVAINTPFNDLYLSAMLPTTVAFSVDEEDAAAEVMVYVDQEIVFLTTIYAYGHDLYLNDIRSVIEEAIRERGHACGGCALMISDGESSASTQDFIVVLSDFVVPSPAFFLASHFMTTRSSYRIHRYGKQLLTWTSPSNASEMRYVDAVILPEGEGTPTVLRWEEGSQLYVKGRTYDYVVSVQTISDFFEQNFPEEKGKLLSFTVHVGLRSMTFFVTEEQPDFMLSFRNAFNVTEYAEFYAVTTRKQKVERSEAHFNDMRVFYDQDTQLTFEVETAALPYEEAVWLNQLLASRYVAMAIDGEDEEVLITDSSSEITDSDKEQNRLKFTYKFARDRQHHGVAYPPNCFTEEYNRQFM